MAFNCIILSPISIVSDCTLTFVVCPTTIKFPFIVVSEPILNIPAIVVAPPILNVWLIFVVPTTSNLAPWVVLPIPTLPPSACRANEFEPP